MEKKQHPSYGMIRICRSQVGGPGTALFGSSIMHNNVIRLSISRGELERERNEDKFYAKGSRKDKIVEVEMSYTQFAEAITSLNIGEGIPVTITNINGEQIEQCPYRNRQKIMRREMNEAVHDVMQELEKRSEEIEKLLKEKRVLSREDRDNILWAWFLEAIPADTTQTAGCSVISALIWCCLYRYTQGHCLQRQRRVFYYFFCLWRWLSFLSLVPCTARTAGWMKKSRSTSAGKQSWWQQRNCLCSQLYCMPDKMIMLTLFIQVSALLQCLCS